MDALPTVRFELRLGQARPTTHDMTDAAFLIGSVPGCDVRLPGTAMPPVFCVITRQPEAVVLRKLAPTQPLLVNGKSISVSPLADGDRVSFGAVDLIVQIDALRASEPAPQAPEPVRAPPPPLVASETNQRQQDLDEQTRELETDRILWYHRREEIERECRQQTASLEIAQEQLADQRRLTETQHDLEQREQALLRQRDQIVQQQRSLETREEAWQKHHEELESAQKEFTAVRQRLHDRYRQRRDRLAGLHEAVSRAARKVQERKRDIDAEAARLATLRAELTERQTELDHLFAALETSRSTFEEQRATLEIVSQTTAQQQSSRHSELEALEQRLAAERRDLERCQAEHQADLVRFERKSAHLEQWQKQLEGRSQEIEERFGTLQEGLAELEDQARRLDDAQVEQAAAVEQFERDRTELVGRLTDLTRRTTELDGQQAMLATLRSRLERMREEVRRESQELVEQRTRQEEAEAALLIKQQEVQRLRAELESERHVYDRERQAFQERSTVLEEAVARVRHVQEELAEKEDLLKHDLANFEARSADQLEQTALVKARATQLDEQQKRLETERQSLREREQALQRGEQTREALQEQLRRRAEELGLRQREMLEQIQKHEGATAQVQEQLALLEAQRAELALHQTRRQQDLEARQTDLDRAEQKQTIALRKLQDMGRFIAAERKSLAEERARLTLDRQNTDLAAERTRAELTTEKSALQDLQRQLPELEVRALAAVERLTATRDRLRDHLNELHTYAREAHEGLEASRSQLQTQAEEVRQREIALRKAQDEHRLAVAGFRQQIIDWQGQVTDLKSTLEQGETRLERREAEVAEKARAIDADAARLADQVEAIHAEQRLVHERRAEMERHLADMREWYRQKLRELSASASAPVEPARPPVVADGLPAKDILSLTGEVDPGDGQLGDLLRSLELVDPETLTALLVEARRQRRSLRQLLLAGGYLTLYQLALIEAGNLDGLVLGPTRVIERVRATAREAVYRVYDPRRRQEVLLRHLTEIEAQDAVHPDEFRQRFGAAAALQHPHLTATLEVLDIDGRPAVLQEWPIGLSSTDWPALVAVPGVWFRLVSQAALGLHTIHQAGLVHGCLDQTSILLNPDGLVKISGLGEPTWLREVAGNASATEDTAQDLAALGTLVAGWADLAARSGKKPKPLPVLVQNVLKRLTATEAAERYANTTNLLDDLDRAGADVPANAEAWDRLLRHIRETLHTEPALRRSA